MKRIAFVIGIMTALWVFGKLVVEKDSYVFSSEIAQQTTPVAQELDSINKEIEVLKDRRNMYLARAYNNDLNAERWQFESNRYLDARQAWNDADADREAARRIQLQIDALEKKREQILVQHPDKR